MRPVLRHGEARAMADALDEAALVVVGELGKDSPVGRRRETVGVGEVNDVFQVLLSPFLIMLREAPGRVWRERPSLIHPVPVMRGAIPFERECGGRRWCVLHRVAVCMSARRQGALRMVARRQVA